VVVIADSILDLDEAYHVSISVQLCL